MQRKQPLPNKDPDSESRTKAIFGLQVHAYTSGSTTEGNPLDGSDITAYVTSLRMNLTLTRPWETCAITLAMPSTFGVLNRNIKLDKHRVPNPGDWIVIRSYNAKGKPGTTLYPAGDATQTTVVSNTDRAAIFFGYVTRAVPRATVAEDGKMDLRHVDVSAVSWMEILGKNQVYVAPQARNSVGTFFARSRNDANTLITAAGAVGAAGIGDTRPEPTRTWDELIDALVAALQGTQTSAEFQTDTEPRDVSDAAGKSLEKAWVSLAAMRLPTALANRTVYRKKHSTVRGDYLGDQVPVVYNYPTRNQYAPRMTVDSVPGWSLEGLKSIYPQGQSTLDILTGSYMGDQNMMEFFPSLEPFDQTRLHPDQLGHMTAAATRRLRTRQEADKQAEIVARSGAKSASEGIVGLAAAAKVALGLLGSDVLEPGGGGGLDAQQNSVHGPASQLARALGVNPVVVYRMKPWRTQELPDYRRNSTSPTNMTGTINTNIFRGITWNRKVKGQILHGFSYTGDEIKAWTGTFDDADHVNCVSVGLPTQANSAIQFLSQAGLPLLANIAVEEAGLRHFNPRWPFWPPLDQKNKDTNLLSSIYTVALQAMQFMGAADRFFKGDVTFAKFSPELRPGMTVELEMRNAFAPELGVMTAYVEGVSHTISVNEADGKISSSTSIQYSRGGLSDEIYLNQFDTGVKAVVPDVGVAPSEDILDGVEDGWTTDVKKVVTTKYYGETTAIKAVVTPGFEE